MLKRLKLMRLPKFPSISISTQVPLLLGSTLLVSLLLAGSLLTRQITEITHQQAQYLGETLAKQTANTARDFLVSGDRLSLTVLLNQLTRSDTVARATIFSVDNKRIASTESKTYDPDKSYILYSAPIDYQNVIAGQLRLELDLGHFEKTGKQTLWLFIGMAFLLGATGTIVAWNYAKSRQLLLNRSVRQLQGLTHGRIAFDETTHDEFEQLSRQLEYLIIQDRNTPDIQPEPVQKLEEKQEPEDGIILAVRLSNLSRLHRSMNQIALLNLLEEQLPYIAQAAKLHNGTITYSAEGNAYILFSKDLGINAAIFKAICCARLIQRLLKRQHSDETPALEVELGISTIEPQNPGENHPSLADSAASQSLMLANLGQGRLLLDGYYTEESLKKIQTPLHETTFGEDISEVGALPEQFQLLLDRQAQQILSQE
ncbi:AhpA/YtjB family protein [Parendozoicomonas haliclonae]|uniref:Bacterial virulence factor hemolysin n=1 Tax=Parendozoicomonas haliclonae TaxID=1960125 RepID=A0A1X7APV8_9GAMM|nr:AhpA/YtjB family protein [Parendozoicomonas haliclonae]SMA50152.1 Bacterial virulence factor hemolysin [Parendozoicomonas haliclonae]